MKHTDVQQEQKVERKPRALLQGVMLAVLSGVLLSAGFLVETLFFTAWFALVPLLLALEGQERGRAMLLGLITGFVTHLLGFYWLVETMVRFGGIPYPISLILFLLIATVFGLIHLLFALGYYWGSQGMRLGSLGQALFIAALYTTVEFLYPHVFPWRLGNTQIAWLSLVQIADVTGVYGVTFLIVLVNTLLFQSIIPFRKPDMTFPWRGIMLTGVLLGFTAGYGFWRLNHIRALEDNAQKLRVALLQPNIPLTQKYSRRFAEEQLQILGDLSQQVITQGAQLVVWPETAYRYWVPTDTEMIPLPLTAPPSSWFLIGANTFTERPNRRENFNSALLLSAQGQILGRYDKHELLMFGEYIPFENIFPFLKGISTAIGEFTPGSGEVILSIPEGPIIAPLICYEDILPPLSRQAVRQGAHLLINLTNDAWFGPTRAPYQHELLARFRAIENRRPLIRATNTGVTSIIHPNGTRGASVDIYTEATITQDIPLLTIQTVYTQYGDLFAFLTILIVVGGLWQSYVERSLSDTTRWKSKL